MKGRDHKKTPQRGLGSARFRGSHIGECEVLLDLLKVRGLYYINSWSQQNPPVTAKYGCGLLQGVQHRGGLIIPIERCLDSDNSLSELLKALSKLTVQIKSLPLNWGRGDCIHHPASGAVSLTVTVTSNNGTPLPALPYKRAGKRVPTNRGFQ